MPGDKFVIQGTCYISHFLLGIIKKKYLNSTIIGEQL